MVIASYTNVLLSMMHAKNGDKLTNGRTENLILGVGFISGGWLEQTKIGLSSLSSPYRPFNRFHVAAEAEMQIC